MSALSVEQTQVKMHQSITMEVLYIFEALYVKVTSCSQMMIFIPIYVTCLIHNHKSSLPITLHPLHEFISGLLEKAKGPVVVYKARARARA